MLALKKRERCVIQFYCYRYQLPNDYSYLNSQELSSEKLTPEEAKAKKNELFAKYVKQACLEMEKLTQEKYIYKIEANVDSIFFIKIDKKGSVNLKDSTLDNVQKAEHYNHQAWIIIDNSPNNQVIAYQNNSSIKFSTVKKYFFKRISKMLNATFLTLLIEPISSEAKFWDVVYQYKGRITDLYFSVYAQNMPVLTEDANEFIAEMRNQINAEKTELHASSKTGLKIDPDNNYIKSMAESASLGISTLTLSAKTNQEDSNTAIVYDSASEEIVDSFTMRKEQITQIIDASQTGLNDDINKIIATLKNYLKSHEIKPYE